MKFLVSCVVGAFALTGTGCASHVQRQVEYDTYVQAKLKIAEAQAAQKPVLEFKGTDSGGKELHIVVNLPTQMPDVQQIKPREDLQFWGQVISGTLPVIGSVATTWVSSHYSWKDNEAMWDAIGGSFGSGITVGGDATITGSGNKLNISGQGGDMALSDFLNNTTEAAERPASRTTQGLVSRPATSTTTSTGTTTTTP